MAKDLVLAFGEDKAEFAINAYLANILTDLVMFFNVGKTMNTSQVNEVVKLLRRDYYFLKPSELKYCFDNAKKGKYGQLFDRIDGAVIFDWIEKYLQEKMDIVITSNENKSKEFNSISIEPDSPIVKILKEAVSKPNVVVKTENDTSATPAVKNATDRIIQDLMKEFDDLYQKANKNYGGKRFIDFEGKILDQDEFINYQLTK